MTERAFTIVVGAGPAGAVAARELARSGLGRVVLLEKARFPRVKPCASGLSVPAQKALARLGLLERVAELAYPIRTGVIHAPSGRQIVLEGDAESLVLDRERLDQLLVDDAVASGAEFRDGIHVRRLRPGAAGGLEVVTDDGQPLTTRFAVVATGATDHLMGQKLPASRLVTMTGWYRNLAFGEYTAELIFDRELAPHYGWVFPEAPDRVNVGLCVDARNTRGRRVRDLLQRFIDRHLADRLATAEPVRPWRGFPIAAAATPAVPTHLPNALPVGEAAHLAAYATGEGISSALSSGRLAADCIVEAAQQGHSARTLARRYTRALQWHLAPRLWVSERLAHRAPAALDVITLAGQARPFRWALARTLAQL